MRVNVQTETYRYSYSLDGQSWQDIEIDFDSYKLSDDFVQGGGFFTGAFVGMQCQDTSGEKQHADFDYFTYQSNN